MHRPHRPLGVLAAVVLLAAGVTAPAIAQVDADRLSALEARSIGPAGMSGRIAALDVLPGDPPTIYAGAATGGLWKSADGGTTWTPIFDDQPSASIGDVAISPANPDLVWVGTGESNLRNSMGVGKGVFKTLDGGDTWTHVGLAQSEHIEAIIPHPTNPDIAYVSSLGPAWSDGGQRGIYKTADGGESWERILYVDERTGGNELVMDPRNPDKLFASMYEYRRRPWFYESGGPGSGLYVTYDGGESWKEFTEEDGMPAGELGRIGIAIAPSDPDVVYALVEADPSALLRSDDGGRSWQTMRRGPEVGNRPFYYTEIRVDPANENRLYDVAGSFRYSEDGGETIETLVGWDIHPDHHALWIDPNDPEFMVVGNDGGVYISRDRGESWRFVENLPLAQFYEISVDMETPFNVYGGLQDNGSWRGPSRGWGGLGIRSLDWVEIGFGDGFGAVDDPASPHYGYSMSQGGNLMRFDLRTGERKDIRPWAPDGVDLRFNWNSPIAVDPFDPRTIYYGSQFVHRSPDRGESWEIISPDLTTNDSTKQRQRLSGGLTRDVTNAENFTTIYSIDPSPVERGVIWAGTDDGNVQLTRNGGESWTNVVDNMNGVPVGGWVQHVEASKHDAATAYVVFDDHRRGNRAAYVFRTTNRGMDWENLATDAIGDFARTIEEDPVDPNVLYLGTEDGLYVSLDAGESWSKWTHGVPTVPVHAIVVHPREHDLVLGTHGRGAYVLDDVRPLRAIAADAAVLEQPVHLFEPPVAYQHAGRQIRGQRFMAHALWQGDDRPYGALLTYGVGEAVAADDDGDAAETGETAEDGGDEADRPEARIEVLDEAGEVIRTFDGPAEAGLNRVAWDLRRDGFQEPSWDLEDYEEEEAGDEGPFGPPGGPLVLPGTYTVRVAVGEHTAEQTVEVVDDPRAPVALADRRLKLDALMRVGAKIEETADAVRRLVSTTDALRTLLGELEKRDDEALAPLRDSARAVESELVAMTERFLGPEEDGQGIFDDGHTIDSKLGDAYGTLSSSRDAPTPTEEIYVRQAFAAADAALADADRLFAEDVSAFRAQLESSGFTLFPDETVISRVGAEGPVVAAASERLR